MTVMRLLVTTDIGKNLYTCTWMTLCLILQIQVNLLTRLQKKKCIHIVAFN